MDSLFIVAAPIVCMAASAVGGSGPPEKSQSYQASIQCWAIVCRPEKRHLGVSLAKKAFRWRVDDGPFIVIFGSSIPSSTKKTLSKDPL